MESKVYSVKGEEVRTVELDDEVFGLPDNDGVVWYAINNELANRRLGTASTKTRSEVHGSNVKPYKQKGTGRARRGDRKSPLLVGGGVIFGPKPRDFSYSMPKKAKRLAMKTILSLKARSGMLKLIEDFSLESGKTRDMAAILANFGEETRTVFILGDDFEAARMIRRAGRNIPSLSFLTYSALCAHTLFYGRRVIMEESAALKLSEFYRSKK